MSFHGETEGSYVPPLDDLLPKGMSRVGFLAEGQTLEQVVRRDADALRILGYSAKEVAELLKPVSEVDGGEYVAPNGKKYVIEVESGRGWQHCPWRGEPIPPGASIDLSVKANTGRATKFPGMLPHLIGAHNFFEGGPYRFAPEDIVEMFGVERNPGSIEQARQLPL